MPILSTDIERNIFKMYVQQVETAYTIFEQRLRDYIASRMALGFSRAEVIAELQDDKELRVFTALSADLESALDFGLNTTFQIASNEPLKNVKSKMVWVLDPLAEHCDSCLYQSSLPPRNINEIPVPSTQPTNGETNCGIYCKCTIEPVNG